MTADPAVLADRVQGVLDVPLHRWLGLALADPADPRAGIVLPVGPPALNNAGVLHGGIVAALLDVAAYVRLLPDLGAEENAVTHDATSSLLRGVGEGARVLLRAEVVRRGRTLAFLRSEATVDGEVVAMGSVTKSLLRPRA
ncbi:PaaI family thioesterase [Geodermatophilus sp. SYSU D00758]